MSQRRPNEPGELDHFKSAIDLRQVAAAFGWQVDARKTGKSRHYTVMRSRKNSVIVIGMNGAHWVFFRSGSAGDHGDGGTIVDFLQDESALNLGQVRAWCREWLGTERHVEPAIYAQPLTAAVGNPVLAGAEWAECEPVDAHPYLLDRGISAEILISDRFRGAVRGDFRGNACFAYVDASGELCGIERRNRPARPGLASWKSYTKSGEKGLWLSRRLEGDLRLVVVESPIDAMAHEVLHGDGRGRYVATGGSYGAGQAAIMARVIEALPDGAPILVAMDNDAGGKRMGDEISEMSAAAGRQAIRALPRLKDWSDDLAAAINLSSVNLSSGEQRSS